MAGSSGRRAFSGPVVRSDLTGRSVLPDLSAHRDRLVAGTANGGTAVYGAIIALGDAGECLAPANYGWCCCV